MESLCVYMNIVCVYILNNKGACIVQTNFRCRLEAIQHVRCRRQKGGSDCEQFAIAMAMSLAVGEDPSSKEYLQEEMRKVL